MENFKNKLILGDCIQVMKEIPDGYVDMILTDLPYGTTKCKWDIPIDLNELWREYLRISKKNSAIVLFAIQPFTSILGYSNIKMLKYSWVWNKMHTTGYLNAKKRPMKMSEDILVFYEKQPIYNPQNLIYKPKKMINSNQKLNLNTPSSTINTKILKKEYMQEYQNYPTNILNFKSENKNKIHPTKKPIPLLEYLIKTYTDNEDIVLDSCMGSGSTCIASLNTGRNFIGIEKDPKYFEIAKKIIEK